jgi:hypothetical protein
MGVVSLETRLFVNLFRGQPRANQDFDVGSASPAPSETDVSPCKEVSNTIYVEFVSIIFRVKKPSTFNAEHSTSLEMSTLQLPGADQPDINRGPEILGAVVSVTVMALVTVCARVIVRLHYVRNFGKDVR